MTHVTQILHSIVEGDSKAADELLPLEYREVRKLVVNKLVRR